ncbi:MAG: hypothetical protein NTW80_02630 [Deltaproteobacteria bacterium]|nr:hypothetical protein [Deltaproteobacteria bacterium]
MGRTVLPSYSHVWEEERLRWQKFRRALRREDQTQFDRLFELARLHLQAGVYASNPWPLEVLCSYLCCWSTRRGSALWKNT